MNMYKILLVEDEKSIVNFLTTILHSKGYEIETAANGINGLLLFERNDPDLILLDLGLPDMDGLQFLKKIRETSEVPIIIISARGAEGEKVKALDLGADDYLSKPFGTDELLARIRTALRHSLRKINSCREITRYKYKDLLIDFDKHTITLNNEIIHLTQNEFKIIKLLAENGGKVLTHSHIINLIWGFQNGEDNKILRVNMANIRRKIEKNPAQPQYIFTEVGIGYRMPEGEEISC